MPSLPVITATHQMSIYTPTQSQLMCSDLLSDGIQGSSTYISAHRLQSTTGCVRSQTIYTLKLRWVVEERTWYAHARGTSYLPQPPRPASTGGMRPCRCTWASGWGSASSVRVQRHRGWLPLDFFNKETEFRPQQFQGIVCS
jgi:hypothetical protein